MMVFDEDQILSEIFASNTLRDKGVNLNIAISENGANIQKQRTFVDEAVDVVKATPGAVGDFGVGVAKGVPTGASKFGTEIMDTITNGAYSQSFIPFVNEKLPIIGDINNYINNLLKPEGTAQEVGSAIGEGVGQVVLPGAVGTKALQGANIGSTFLRNVLGYGSAEVIGMNAQDQGLLELGTSFFVSNDNLKQEIINSLKADEDQSVLMQKIQKAPQRFFEGGIVGEALGKALEGVGVLYRAMKGSDKIKNALQNIGEKAQGELDLDGNTTTLSSMGGGEIDKAINKGLSKLAPNKVVKLDDTKDKVIVQHNINETALLEADKIGGLPVPSLAISKADNAITGFGDVTLIGNPTMAKPSGGNPVFRADGYTTRRPKAEIFVNKEAENFAENNVTNVFADIPRGSSVSQLDGAIVNKSIAEDLFKGFEGSYSNIPLRAKYMIDKGLLDPKKFETQFDIARFVRTEFRETEDYYNYIGKLRKDMLASGGDAKEKLFVEFTNTGRKYLPATLENYVRLMKKNKGAGQENLMLTMGALRAKVTPKFRNISQIKAERSKIVNNEDFVKAKNMVEQDYTDFMGKLRDVLPKDIDFRTAEELFNDIVTNRLGSHPYSKPYESKITEEILNEGTELRQKLINLPTEYFEIKPQRAVKLNEFNGAIVPENALKSTLEILKKNGITKIFKYKNEDERKKLVSKFPEFMFTASGLAVGSSAMQGDDDGST